MTHGHYRSALFQHPVRKAIGYPDGWMDDGEAEVVRAGPGLPFAALETPIWQANGTGDAMREIEKVALVGGWPSLMPNEEEVLVGGATVIRCSAELRPMTRLFSRDRFQWLIIGADQDESIIGSVRLLRNHLQPAMRWSLAGLGSADDGERCERFLRRGCNIYLNCCRDPMTVLGVLGIAQSLHLAIIDDCFRAAQSANDALTLVAPLTRTETEVVRLLASGQSNAEIAKRRGVRISTVEYHVGNILAKIGVNNRTAAAARARVLGL